MTAEIAILNKTGVALAADSAVTLGGGEGKIYTSADKLFQLSTIAPVGIMVYGNTNLAGVPWETIIKAYRENLGEKTYGTLEDYGRGFLDFLSENPTVFHPEVQIREAKSLVKVLLENVRDDIYKKLKKDTEKNSNISEDEIKKAAKEVIEAKLVIVRKQGRIRGLSKNIGASLRKKLGKSISSMQHETFKKLPMTAQAKRSLKTMCVEILTREVFSSRSSGVVIAGFGEREYAPVLLDVDIDGLIENRPRYLIKKKHVIDDNTISSIIPFAQKEVVYTFMEGIDPRLEDMINKTTASLFYGVSDAIMGRLKNTSCELPIGLKKKIDKALKTLIADLFSSWKSQRRRVHWGPVTTIVSALPKDELAGMAEALVNLTKFRRRVSTERETVGGPIDVAIITKGDGFIWVKRKHYFDPWLNLRAMGRYLKEVL